MQCVVHCAFYIYKDLHYYFFIWCDILDILLAFFSLLLHYFSSFHAIKSIVCLCSNPIWPTYYLHFTILNRTNSRFWNVIKITLKNKCFVSTNKMTSEQNTKMRKKKRIRVFIVCMRVTIERAPVCVLSVSCRLMQVQFRLTVKILWFEMFGKCWHFILFGHQLLLNQFLFN